MSRAEIDIQDETTLQNPSKVVPLVRNWLDRSENWLLILDGALCDTPNLKNCIPDARNSSLILTNSNSDHWLTMMRVRCCLRIWTRRNPGPRTISTALWK
ncbi:hypothetical protein LB505_005489 [Fusarium chuoi]|nr:hypothetical protein LB505_005489 [Fusarium chuoi]